MERSFQRLEEKVDRAREAYVKQNDAAQATDLLEQVLAQYPVLEARIIKLKERTLLWIYIIEWLVVTSTLVIMGTVVWSLMVRRRLYRQVSTTMLMHHDD